MAISLESMLKPLSWDSAHFGVEVARIEPADIDDRTLQDLLVISRQKKFSLVYWAARGSRKVPDAILHGFCGSRVDQKVTYVVDLDSWTCQDTGDCRDPSVRIREYPRGPAAAPLLELGRTANAFSRFVNDPRIPFTKADELFEIWTEKSTRGEMAEVVFIAQRADSHDAIVGMVTVSRRQDGGQIGLIAVNPNVRGIGVGTALVHSANRWIVGAGPSKGWVVTQRANTNACRLYERTGYRFCQLEEVYHFWPLAQ